MTSMNIHVIVPVKDLQRAKSRLAELLAPDERRALVLAMLRRVLTVLLGEQNDPLQSALRVGVEQTAGAVASVDIAQIWVISADATVWSLATALGACPLPDQASDLNAALEQARAVAYAAGAEALLIIPADVPLITAADRQQLLAALYAGAAFVIAPDHTGQGTNALGFRLPSSLAFQFGPDSFAQHINAAQRAGLVPQIYVSPTLALDIDTTADLRQAGFGSTIVIPFRRDHSA